MLFRSSSHPYELLERLSASLPYDEHDLASLVVTDPRAGNVAGLRAVLQHYRVGEVLDPGVQYPSRTYAGWRSDLRRLHIPVLALRTGTILLFGDVTLEAVAPDGLRYRPIDSVGMLRIWSRRTSVLVAGASSQLEQHEAVFRSVPLRADVLVNAATRCDTAFLRHIAAKHVYGQSCPHAVLPGPNKPVAVFR